MGEAIEKKKFDLLGNPYPYTMEFLREEAEKYPEVDVDAAKKYNEFSEKFGYDKLETLSDDMLPNYIFPGTGDGSLCEVLEKKSGGLCSDFGGIKGRANPSSYGLYKDKKNGKWNSTRRFSGESGELKDQSDDGKALDIGRRIRDDLVNGAKCIESWPRLETEDDYVKLYKKLMGKGGKDECGTDGLISNMWLRKYYHMLFPKHFSTFYDEAFLNGALECVGLPTDGDKYAKSGRIACFIKECGISTRMMGHLYYKLVTEPEINKNKMSKEQKKKEVEKKGDKKAMAKTEYHKNLILFGAPGTGKTYSTVTMALDIMGVEYNGYDDAKKEYDKLRTVDVAPDKEGGDGGESKGKKSPRIQFVTFHQSYGYEEFIEGIRPKTKNGAVEYEIKPGVFKEFCDTARRDNDNKYVFIIDEINRGNISKIFGELITLIEDNKREGASEAASAILPYSGKPFSVPANVYILGTMNTADRSITSIDTALRRRFYFKEMAPEPKLLKDMDIEGINEHVDFELMLKTMNERIEALYDRDHCIGHAYFMGLKDNPTMKKLADIFKNRIIPLLQEYFFDDYGKIRLVLGDNQKNEEDLQFIRMESKDIKKLFGEDIDDVRNRETYSINEDALEKPDAYKKIYKENS